MIYFFSLVRQNGRYIGRGVGICKETKFQRHTEWYKSRKNKNYDYYYCPRCCYISRLSSLSCSYSLFANIVSILCVYVYNVCCCFTMAHANTCTHKHTPCKCSRRMCDFSNTVPVRMCKLQCM